MPLLEEKIYTIEAIYALPEGERAELIDGKNKLTDNGCTGAPDWIIEIVSPASRRMDYYTKLFKYRTAGVREYWIIDAAKNQVVVYDFVNGDMAQYTLQDSVKAGIYEDCVIDFGSMDI